jgi:hypothetical protein
MITLNKEDIIRMAKEADPDVVFEEFLEDHVLVFKRFAALVAATSATAEREKCAKVCEDGIGICADINDQWDLACIDRAAAIRARERA